MSGCQVLRRGGGGAVGIKEQLKGSLRLTVMYQCQYPTCDIVLQDAIIGGDCIKGISLLFLKTACESNHLEIKSKKEKKEKKKKDLHQNYL